MPHLPGCPFCDIVSGASAVDVVHETAHTLAFTPRGPATEGHTLVIPKVHATNLWKLPADLVAPLFEAVREVGDLLWDEYLPDGMNVIHSAGAAATQTVFHLHVHLVPRYAAGDRMGPIWPERA